MSARALTDPDPTGGQVSLRPAAYPRRWRPLLRLRYALGFAREIVVYSVLHREWWLAPLIMIILLCSLLAVLGQGVVPFTVYTLF